MLYEFVWRRLRADKHARFATGNLGCTWWGATVSLKQNRREGEVRLNSASVKTTKKVLLVFNLFFLSLSVSVFFPCRARAHLERPVHKFTGGCNL